MEKATIDVFIKVNLHNNGKGMIILFNFIYFETFASFCGFSSVNFERNRLCLNNGSCWRYIDVSIDVFSIHLPDQFHKVKVCQK